MNIFSVTQKVQVAAAGILTGPFGHYWYLFLERKFTHRSSANILKKMLCDQLIAAPIFNILFISVIHTLDGKHIRQIAEIFKDKFLTIYAVSSFSCLFFRLKGDIFEINL
jgi:protein Mpv17